MNIENVKKMRGITGLGLVECKIVLEAAGGDLDTALSNVKDRAKPSTKPVGAGAVFAYVHHNRKVCAVVELHCGTDFVALNEQFELLGNDIAMQVAAMEPLNVEDLMYQKWVKDESRTIKELLDSFSARFNEPIKVVRFVILEVSHE
jgi:elongation factor Ts